MQQVARYSRNHELHIEVNYSCNKLHATYEIVNYTLGLTIRATSCTLRGINNPTIRQVSVVSLIRSIAKIFSVHRLSYA